MDIIVKNLKEFPNWHLALDFLRRSRVNFLIATEFPSLDVPENSRPQILLQGCAGEGLYLVAPDHYSQRDMLILCTSIAHQRSQEAPWLGSIRSTNFINFLNEFAHVLAGKFELDEVAQAITDKTTDLFEADGASILMPTGDGQFRFAYLTTPRDDVRRRIAGVTVSDSKGVIGWVAKNRRSILVNDDNRAEIFDPNIDLPYHFKTRDVIATPIWSGDLMIGMLLVLNKRSGSFQKTDLRLIQLIAAIIAVFIDKARLYDVHLTYVQVKKELEIAHTLQLDIMPELPSRVGPFLLHGESLQVSRVGGDFWDVLELNETEKLLILGDVSGHGLSAALLMSSVRTALRALLSQVKSPYALIEPLNQLIHKEFGFKGHYVTLILCHLDLEKHEFHYFRGGHQFPILYTNGEYRPLKKTGGLPLGLFPFRKTDLWFRHTLEPGEALYLYTDGIMDGIDGEGDNAFEDLEDLLAGNPDLEQTMEQGEFFKTLSTRYQWRENDDATILRLTRA